MSPLSRQDDVVDLTGLERADASRADSAHARPQTATQTDQSGVRRGGIESPDDRGRLGPLLNGLSVLKTFTIHEPLLGVTEIATRVGLHKSTVSRILAALEQEGFVERDHTSRRFRLGLGVIALAGPLLADLEVRHVGYPTLQDLTVRTGETSALMIWNEQEAVCVDQVPSPNQIKHSTAVGTRYSTGASACVRVLTAALPRPRVAALISSGTLTGPGTSSVEAYLERLDQVAEDGYAVNYGETTVDEVGVAAPVRDHRGQVVAAVLISAPKFRVSTDRVALLVEAVRAAADEITSRLGGRPG